MLVMRDRQKSAGLSRVDARRRHQRCPFARTEISAHPVSRAALYNLYDFMCLRKVSHDLRTQVPEYGYNVSNGSNSALGRYPRHFRLAAVSGIPMATAMSQSCHIP